MIKRSICYPAGFAWLLLACGHTAMAADAPTSPVVIAVPQAVRTTAAKPTPSADARKVGAIGTGQLQVSTATGASDTDALWGQKIDITGDGLAEDTQLLWNDEDAVLYLYATGPLACTKGGKAEASLLILLYGNANNVQQATGAGAYVVQLDSGECGAKAAGLFGCKFDARGTPTACGAAVLDKKTGALNISPAPR